MTKNLLFLSLLLFALSTKAQDSDIKKTGKPVKFGKIDLTEFDLKPEGKDSSASALILFDKGDVRFEINGKSGGFRYIFVKHTRILILKKEAYNLANIEIGLYKSKNGVEELLTDFNGSTYNLDNTTITTSKIGKDAKFSEKFDKRNTIRKFTLPNVKEGTIIEYKYEIRSDFIFSLRSWAFQSSVPTISSDFTITIPEYFDYKKYIRGYHAITEVEHKSVNETFGAAVQGSGFNAPEQVSLTCSSNFTHYNAKNVPALKDESFITTLDDYNSKIEFEIRSTNFPNSGFKSYTATWDQIIDNLKTDENFGGVLKSTNYIKSLSNDIIKGETEPLKKLNRLFAFVKENVKYNGNDNIYSSEQSLKQVVENKAGNVADINLLLVNMLSQVGIKAFPILVSTRSNGLHPGYELIGKFNYVIAGVTIDSSEYILDATDINHGLNMVRFDCLNHKGLALDMENKKAEWIPIELRNPSQNYLSYQLKMSADNIFTGMVYERKTEFENLSNRKKITEFHNNDEFLQAYKKDRNGLKIENFKINNLDSLFKPISFEYLAKMEDMVEEAGNLVYFTPLLYERTKENPFKLDERNFPVDFGYAFEEVYRITIELPENFTLDKMPKSELFKLEDNSAYFSYLAAVQGKTLNVVSKIHVGKSQYDKEYYFELKELFKKIVSKQAEQIVLKKI